MCLGLLGSCNIPSPGIKKRTQRFVNWICSHPRWIDRETETKSQSLDLVQFQKRYEKRVPGNLLIIRILQKWTRHNRHPAVLIAFGFHQFHCVSVRLENLTVNQLAKKNSPSFITPEDSIPRSQKIWLNIGYSNQTNPSIYTDTSRIHRLKLCATYSSIAVAWSTYQPHTPAPLSSTLAVAQDLAVKPTMFRSYLLPPSKQLHEAQSFLGSQKTLRWYRNDTFFCKLYIQYRIHKSPPPSQFMTTSHFFLKIHLNIIHPFTPRSSLDIFLSGFPSKPSMQLFFLDPLRAACTV
jgi:hypothetical protein